MKRADYYNIAEAREEYQDCKTIFEFTLSNAILGKLQDYRTLREVGHDFEMAITRLRESAWREWLDKKYPTMEAENG